VPVGAIAGAAAGGGIALTVLLVLLIRCINKRRQRKLEDDILNPPANNTRMSQAFDSGPKPRSQHDSGYYNNPYARDTMMSNSTTTGGYQAPMAQPDAFRSPVDSSRPRAMSSDSQYVAGSMGLSGDGHINLAPQQVLQLHPSSQPADVSTRTGSGHQHHPSSTNASNGGGAGHDPGPGPDVDIGQGSGGYSGYPEV